MTVWASPRRKARLALLGLPLAFILLHTFNNSYPDYYYPLGSTERGWKRQTEWWADFFSQLEAVRPLNTEPVKIPEGEKPPEYGYRPDVDHARPELVQGMTAADQSDLAQSHASFVKQLPDFARRLPFDRDTAGIVTTAGANNFGQVVTMMVMVRQSGSKLPVQIVLDSTDPWIEELCANQLRRLGATCIRLDEIWSALRKSKSVPATIERYQWKVMALLASTFQDVLFLDADCLAVVNPDPILRQGSEPFASTGLITWPDFWSSTSSARFYAIAGDVAVPPLSARASSESGVMVLDKARHADTLLLAAYYNYYGPAYYYPLLTQHGPGEGDKETFLHAAMVLETLSKQKEEKDGTTQASTGDSRPIATAKQTRGYWDVKTLPGVRGRSLDHGEWEYMMMQQMDPMEDYRAQQWAARIDDQTDRDDDDDDDDDDNTDTDTETETETKPPTTLDRNKFLATKINTTTVVLPKPTRYMFFHHNGLKLDFAWLNDPDYGQYLVKTDRAGNHTRLWADNKPGLPAWDVPQAEGARDVEKEMWGNVTELWCETGFVETCRRLRKVYDEVYLLKSSA
ncbi:mannosyltransferase putative-domain-containing protein [Apodospora peruviana]|uniref:Mannosyltransferase putative-domain-containing protein n=1 Tax=Apodospora peruviana TaxID=516989 RepID=A0AAE0M3K2_9PEZI|nr:mannosyltransferase putative-domain-containing protein [Apodospora peruviana]